MKSRFYSTKKEQLAFWVGSLKHCQNEKMNFLAKIEKNEQKIKELGNEKRPAFKDWAKIKTLKDYNLKYALEIEKYEKAFKDYQENIEKLK